MIVRIKLIFLVFLELLLFTSCIRRTLTHKEVDFLNMFPNVEMNKKVKLVEPRGISNKYNFNEKLILVLENETSEMIVFPPDWGIKILSYNEDKWIEITNGVDYLPPVERNIPAKSKDFPGVMPFSLKPEIPNNIEESVSVRIVVLGMEYKNDVPAEKKVGAFIDLKLSP